MKTLLFTLTVLFSTMGLAQLAVQSTSCTLITAPANASDFASRRFVLNKINGQFMEAASPGSRFCTLEAIDPATLKAFPSYDGTPYSCDFDFVFIDESNLPAGVTFKATRPLDDDPYTKRRPSVFYCH